MRALVVWSFLLLACGDAHEREDAGDSSIADTATDTPRDTAADTAMDTSVDGATPSSCDEIAGLPNGAACAGSAYCPGDCAFVRCVYGVVANGSVCVDAGACTPYVYDAECSSDSECAVAWDPDCCGGARGHGIRSDALTSFADYVARCAPEPYCDCLSGLRLDDETPVSDVSEVVSACNAGRCEARLR